MWRETLSNFSPAQAFNFVNGKVPIYIKMHFTKIYKVEQTVQNRFFEENMPAVH